jgi:hypothetical protein
MSRTAPGPRVATLVPLPPYIMTGLVLGRSIMVGVDTGADPDTAPDAHFPAGSVLAFTPSVDTLVFPAQHDTVYLVAISAVIDALGNPVTPDGDPLYLVANTGQPNNDQAWWWSCKPTIEGATKSPFRVDVPAGGVVYLTDQQPIPSSPAGSSVARGPQGDPGVNTPPAGTPDGSVAVSQAGLVTWQGGAGGLQSAVEAMTQRSAGFIASQLGPLGVPTSASWLRADTDWPASYTGPVGGAFGLVLRADEPSVPCPVTVANPVGALPDSFRGTVFGGLAITPRAGLVVQPYKLTDVYYPFVGAQPVDAGTGTWGVDLSGVAPDQKGQWCFGLLDTANGNAQVGEKWPSAAAYADIAAEHYVVTDAVYPVTSETATAAGRFSFTHSLNGRKGYRLTRRSTGEVLADAVPLTGAVRSYLVAPGEPGFATNFVTQTYAYDQAVSLFAAIATGRRDVADRLAAGLLLFQTAGGASDGGFIFSGQQLAPSLGDPAYRTGSHAICTDALLAYIEAYCASEFPGYTAAFSRRSVLVAAASRALAYLGTMMSAAGTTAGLYTGGSGVYDSTSGGQFDPDQDLTWASTEHNLDAWHCLTRAARVLADTGYQASADQLAATIHANLWDGVNGRYYQGMKTTGPDTADPLDCHTWAAIMAAQSGQPDRAKAIVAPDVMAPYYHELHGGAGYAPIRPADPAYPGATPTIWAEGTLSAAMAFLVTGDEARWFSTMAGMLAIQNPDGSFPYVTDAVSGYDWTPSKGVIGPAWAMLAAAGRGIWGVQPS